MKNTLFFLFFFLISFGCKNEKQIEKEQNKNTFVDNNAESKDLEIFKITVAQIPETIKYSGEFKDGYRWKDNTGQYLVFITETGNTRNEKMEHEFDDSGDAELFSYCYKIKDSKYELKWKIYDFINDCPVDMIAEFFENTLQITDLNKDGVAEVWAMYKTVCHGDVSPLDLKIIMYEGPQKYAVRGESKIEFGVDDNGKTVFEGGEYHLDNSFKNGPESFLTYAKKLWSNHMMNDSQN